MGVKQNIAYNVVFILIRQVFLDNREEFFEGEFVFANHFKESVPNHSFGDFVFDACDVVFEKLEGVLVKFDFYAGSVFEVGKHCFEKLAAVVGHVAGF